MLFRFGLNNLKVVATPLDAHFKLSKAQAPSSEEERELMTRVPYANIIESIMYAMIYTRPELAFVVTTISRYMAAPGKDNWHALKWIMRYISGSLDMGFLYGNVRESKETISGYVDVDFAGCIN